MENIRLKMAIQPEQIQDRLKYHPEIVELHLNESDLYHLDHTVKVIQEIKEKGIKVYLHHPSKFKGNYVDIISSNSEVRDYYDWSSKVLAAICKQEQIKCIIHCHYAQSESSDFSDKETRIKMRKRVEQILALSEDTFLWEDTIKGIFSAENPHLLDEMVKPLNLPLNIDVSHSFIALKGDNELLQKQLEQFDPYVKYFHLVDSMGKFHDALPLGQGKIDWKMVKRYVKDKDFIFEIDLRDSKFLDCTKMIESAKYYNNL
jgi:sugar phosphate isomerase/epimerase